MHAGQLWCDIRDAFLGLRRRPLRFVLSSVGIGIGVAALIAMLSISEGARRKAVEKLSSLGTDTLRVEDSTDSLAASGENVQNLSKGLTIDDLYRLENWLGSRGYLGGYQRRDELHISSDKGRMTGTLMGVSLEWFKAEKLELGWGRWFDTRDERDAQSYCIVGSELARELKLNQGSHLHLGGYAATVIGALKSRGRLLTEGTGLSALNFDKSVMMVLSTMPISQSIYDVRRLDGFVLRLVDGSEKNVLQAAEQVHHLLSRNHGEIEDFRLVVPVSLMREVRENQRLFSLVMGVIAGLSLVVGGIGVMNVMLANVSEQTREIGLRKTLGASRARILWFYLWNSMVMTFSGGLWGILAGVLLAYGVQLYAGWEIAFSTPAFVLAPFSALATGAVFGLHPAYSASMLDPAEALRES